MRWRVVEAADIPVDLREAVGGHPLLARLLAQRGITSPQAALRFLDPDRYQPSPPLSMPGVCHARQILTSLALNHALVRIWGDLDADGQTSTAVLFETLKAMGCRVDYRIPTRVLGHGFPPIAVREAAEDGVSLIITCDTGVTDVETVALANELGITVIITDHHDLGETLPEAAAIINPKMLPKDHPAHELAGVGVAFMLARALLDAPRHADTLEALLDLVALGLVADVARQQDDVRYWIQRGLAVLREGRRPGLAALMRLTGVEPASVDEQAIGYQLAPRLNAAGRLGDSAVAVELLLTRDLERAAELAGAIDALNADRRARTDAVFERVQELLQREPATLREPILIADVADFEEGVIGLVAGRLAQIYGRPAIVIAHREGKASVGSARSVEGIDIHAAIASQRELLEREGGHPMAAGFAIEPKVVDTFRNGLLRWYRDQGPAQLPEPEIEVDAIIPWNEVTLSLAHQLERLRPFGSGNPEPVLAIESSVFLRAEDVSRWRETAHRRLFVSGPQGEPHRLTWFNAGELPAPGEIVDLAFALQVNRYNGREEAQLRLEDWRASEHVETAAPAALVRGLEIIDWRNEPSRDDAVARLKAEFEEELYLYPLAKQAPSPSLALAFLSPPPGTTELDALLDAVQPQVIYLLPATATAEPTAAELLQQVAGMVKHAIANLSGQLDLPRMAAVSGQSRAAIETALTWLASAGKVLIVQREASLWASMPCHEPIDGTPALIKADHEEILLRLNYLLAEAAAYRRAWATMSPQVLFGRD